MKKIVSIMAAVLLVCCLLSGCGSGKNSVVGTWYSDRDDGATLTLNKDGTYSDGVWLTSGNYTSDAATGSQQIEKLQLHDQLR